VAVGQVITAVPRCGLSLPQRLESRPDVFALLRPLAVSDAQDRPPESARRARQAVAARRPRGSGHRSVSSPRERVIPRANAARPLPRAGQEPRAWS